MMLASSKREDQLATLACGIHIRHLGHFPATPISQACTTFFLPAIYRREKIYCSSLEESQVMTRSEHFCFADSRATRLRPFIIRLRDENAYPGTYYDCFSSFWWGIAGSRLSFGLY